MRVRKMGHCRSFSENTDKVVIYRFFSCKYNIKKLIVNIIPSAKCINAHVNNVNRFKLKYVP